MTSIDSWYFYLLHNILAKKLRLYMTFEFIIFKIIYI